MIALSVVFTGLYARNLWRWRHNSGRPGATKCDRPCCAIPAEPTAVQSDMEAATNGCSARPA